MKKNVNKVHNLHRYLAWILLQGCLFAFGKFFIFCGFEIYLKTMNGLFKNLLKNFLGWTMEP